MSRSVSRTTIAQDALIHVTTSSQGITRREKWNRLAVIVAKIVIEGCVVLFGLGGRQDVDSGSGLTGLCISVVMITV